MLYFSLMFCSFAFFVISSPLWKEKGLIYITWTYSRNRRMTGRHFTCVAIRKWIWRQNTDEYWNNETNGHKWLHRCVAFSSTIKFNAIIKILVRLLSLYTYPCFWLGNGESRVNLPTTYTVFLVFKISKIIVLGKY